MNGLLRFALPSELFGDSGRSDQGCGQWAHLAILETKSKDSCGPDQHVPAVTRGFPGVDAVCALTLHRLPFKQPKAALPPPVHETAVEWQGALYFAPCANMLAHYERLRVPDTKSSTSAETAGARSVVQDEEAWGF